MTLYDPMKLYRCAICNRPQYMRYLSVIIWSSETPKRGEHVRCKSETACARTLAEKAGTKKRRQRS